MNSLRIYGDDFGIIVKRVRNGFIIERMEFDEVLGDHKKIIGVIEEDLANALGDKEAMIQVLYAMAEHFGVKGLAIGVDEEGVI